MRQNVGHKSGEGEVPFKERLDKITTLVPLAAVILLCIFFCLFPEGSSSVLGAIRFFFRGSAGKLLSAYRFWGVCLFAVHRVFPVWAD